MFVEQQCQLHARDFIMNVRHRSCLPELDDKALMLKMTSYLGCKLELSGKLPHCWQSSKMLEGAFRLLWDTKSRESCPTVTPLYYNAHYLGKVCLLIQYCCDLYEVYCRLLDRIGGQFHRKEFMPATVHPMQSPWIWKL